MKYKKIPPQGKITAYYDFKSSPITFDFVYFLSAAVAYSKQFALNYIDLVVVADAWRVLTPREKAYTDTERIWRLWNLIAQVVQICPHVRNFTIQKSPLMSINPDCYPANYNPRSNFITPYNVRDVAGFHEGGIDVKCFKSSKMSRNFAGLTVNDGRNFITFSPRTAGFDNVRDSDLRNWYEAYKVLSGKGYDIILIPDQDDVLSERLYTKYPWRAVPEAAMSLDLKLGLYESCACNIVSSGGNVGPLIFSGSPFSIVKTVNEGSHVASAKYFAAQGFPVGSQYPWFSDKQRFTWGGDTAEEIIACVEMEFANKGHGT